VFDWCYHGTVDETLVTLDANGHVQPREGRMGPPVDPALTTKAVAFNDADALAAALEPGDVACVLAEPAMTNIGIIHPEPGYLDAVRDLTRRTGTLLIIDETHTICAGPGGYTASHGLEPDLLTIGKPIAAGLPTAAYGMTHEVADRVRPAATGSEGDVSGIGGTLAGNALALAAMRVTLSEVLTDDAFAHTLPLGARWEAGVQSVVDSRKVPWSVTRLGARAEYWFLPRRPRHGAEAAAGVDEELDGFMHPLRAEPRHPAHAVPQHGAHVPRDDRSRRRSPHRGLRRRGRRAVGLTPSRPSAARGAFSCRGGGAPRARST